MGATRNLNNWFVVAAALRFGKIDVVRAMEVDDIWGCDKLSVMQISCRVVAILTLTTVGHLSSHSARAAETPMMKAVVAHEYGGPEVLKFENVPRPEPKENDALVRVIASGVNPA